VFTFGDARFFGSLGGTRIEPIRGMIANGNLGYRLIATTGGATPFGTIS